MSADIFQEILESIDVESYLDREGIQYRHTRGSSGAQLNLCECPACGQAKWKVFLNAETGLGNCFSGDCEYRFNKWSFIQTHLGTTSAKTFEHIKHVAAEQGWRAPRTKSFDVNLNSNELILPESLPFPIKRQNLKYLENRGISIPVAQYFNLRFCMRGQFSYTSDGEKLRQSYSKRIIIPIFDLQGELVSFQGRDITGDAEKKYLFPPGFASTGKHLYNGNNAVGAKRIVVGEGAFDVMAIKIALDEELSLRDVVPVGSFGKHLSHGDSEGNDQLGKIIALKQAGLEEVVIMWDAEASALEAACMSALRIRELGLLARVAVLPEGRDPNEVAASVVRDAFWKAKVATNSMVARTRLLAAAKRLPW